MRGGNNLGTPGIGVSSKAKISDPRGSADQSVDNTSDREESHGQPAQVFRRKARGKLDARIVVGSASRGRANDGSEPK